MLKRDDPSPLRDGYPFIMIHLSDDAHMMKLPSHLWTAKLFKVAREMHITALVAMQNSRSHAAIMSAAKNSGPELFCILGALIGHTWAHQEQALETVEGSDILAYGEAVYEELHDAGYTMSDVLSLGMTLVSSIWEHTEFSAEVREKAGFISQALAEMSSGALTSASATSETHGDSPN